MTTPFINQSDAALWHRAKSCFNQRDWWMVHELLEELWKRNPNTDEAKLYQGLLKAAVCFYHYGNANFGGARGLAVGALELLGSVDNGLREFPVAQFCREFGKVVAPLLEERALRPLDSTALPKW